MTEPLVTTGIDAAVATVTLNRPDKLNAVTPELFEELAAHLDRLSESTDVRCVVLAGAGRSFCAGHDLGSVADDEAAANRYREAEIVDALEALPMPTVAKVRGHCLTGGLELALACDLIVVAESARIADTHGRWGLAPVWGMSVRLPERVGESRAKELSFTSRFVDGREAADIGLADRCVADDDLDAAIDELTGQIAANSVGSNRIYKQLYARRRTLDRRAALLTERDLVFGMPDDARERLGSTRRPHRDHSG
ncbi:enoyl-CoA hydratase/isomerase family protein [Gordonia humi]|uniref:Enoyl-CoA hydratase/carnithine racemase n=1 Tax=Gordonia humi TaxID=686429 RepID=A0A840EX57_9ACTN|nr:enoyl-CoA hydratase/isomerase family protein [Gordonia humi]MBB4133509.1 enoyl-CoA hydratase/carnithine racemase [Gordonia humi]